MLCEPLLNAAAEGGTLWLVPLRGPWQGLRQMNSLRNYKKHEDSSKPHLLNVCYKAPSLAIHSASCPGRSEGWGCAGTNFTLQSRGLRFLRHFGGNCLKRNKQQMSSMQQVKSSLPNLIQFLGHYNPSRTQIEACCATGRHRLLARWGLKRSPVAAAP